MKDQTQNAVKRAKRLVSKASKAKIHIQWPNDIGEIIDEVLELENSRHLGAVEAMVLARIRHEHTNYDDSIKRVDQIIGRIAGNLPYQKRLVFLERTKAVYSETYKDLKRRFNTEIGGHRLWPGARIACAEKWKKSRLEHSDLYIEPVCRKEPILRSLDR